MEIATQKKDSYVVVELRGRLDTTNYSNLESDLNNLIDKGEHSVLVDCKNLDYVSSSGLRVFLVALKKLNSLNGSFTLCSLQDSITEIFEVSGFNSIFDVYANQDEAVKSVYS